MKRVAGRKGTVYEEHYLLNSIKKVAESRLGEVQSEQRCPVDIPDTCAHNPFPLTTLFPAADTSALLPVLLSLDSRDHRNAAFDLQAAVAAFETFLSSAIERVWAPLEAHWRYEAVEEQRIRDTGDPALLMEWEQRARAIEGEEETKRVERPKLASNKWRIGMLSVA